MFSEVVFEGSFVTDMLDRTLDELLDSALLFADEEEAELPPRPIPPDAIPP